MIDRFLLPGFLLIAPLAALISGLIIPFIAGVLLLLLAAPALRHLRAGAYKLLAVDAYAVVGLLMAWPLVSALWSITPKASLNTPLKTALFMVLLLLGLVLARLRPAQVATRAWDAFAIGVLLAGFCILLEQLPGGGPLYHLATAAGIKGEEFYSKDINRGLSALALFTWPACMAFIASGRKRLGLALPFIMLPAIFSMHSLSAKTGLASGLLVFYAMIRYPYLTRRLLLVGLPVAFLMAPLLFRALEPLAHMPSVYEAIPESSQHRLAIWHFAMEKWSENPILGWGADTSRSMPGGEDMSRPGWANLPLHPHNIPIQILLEQGIVGLILSSGAVYLFIRRALWLAPHNREATAAMAAAITGFLVIAMSGFSMWQSWWVCSAIVTALLFGFMLRQKDA